VHEEVSGMYEGKEQQHLWCSLAAKLDQNEPFSFSKRLLLSLALGTLFSSPFSWAKLRDVNSRSVVFSDQNDEISFRHR
jgi:hypothetical protein